MELKLREGLRRCLTDFFTDDSFIFFRANINEASLIKHLLAVYGRAFGQVVNFNKFSISFSANVLDVVNWQVCDILMVTNTTNHGAYLGLPSYIGRKKKEVFSYIRDKLWQRLQGWSTRMIFQAGKEILLKTMALAMPNYAMSIYLLPKELCKELLKTTPPSYVWRSMLAAKDVVIQGSRVQVGSGHTISIRKDPWLPDLNDGFVSSNLNEELATTSISSLMMPNQRVWDYDVVSDIFNSRDKTLIL